MGTFTETVDVTHNSQGVPLRLTWQGRPYVLAAEPLRWYERRNWWEEVTRAAPGEGAGLVAREIWRVQMREDTTPQGTELRTFELVRHLPSQRWRLIKVHMPFNEQSSSPSSNNSSATESHYEPFNDGWSYESE